MKDDYTAIALIVDRSGSMSGVETDTIGGANSFIKTNREAEGSCSFTYVQFDNYVETINDFIDINDMPEITSDIYSPRGMTALYDAIGMTCARLGMKLAELPEDERPGSVIIAIITDGAENNSSEYSYEAIQKIIKEQQDKYNWDFNFISADLEARDDAISLGFAADKVAMYDKASTNATFGAVASKSVRYRNAVASNMVGDELLAASAFTDDELQDMGGEDN